MKREKRARAAFVMPTRMWISRRRDALAQAIAKAGFKAPQAWVDELAIIKETLKEKEIKL